ncbi:MAG: hypothetical protein JST54_15865 [Deltaproteobacteria bacterium]|nr:hypothetical protein [Deltaproteobacteria bacterium]
MAHDLESHLLDQLSLERDYFWHRLRWQAVQAYLPRERAFGLVDVGAGAGLLGESVAEAFPSARYPFVEPIPALHDELVGRHGARADLGRDRPFEGCGVVTLLDVHEHQADDVGLLTALAARMTAGTALILTVPAFPWLWSGWDVALGHFRRYTRSPLRRVLDAARLETLEVSYLFPEMVPAGLARRVRLGARADSDAVALPRLSPWVNQAAYWAGRVSLSLRRFHRVGTSLLAVARKR